MRGWFSRVERGERVEGALRAILGNRLGEEPRLFSLLEYAIMGMSHYEIMEWAANDFHNPIISYFHNPIIS